MMYGWITAIHQLGGASAALLGGILRVDLGTYLEAFMLSGLLCLVAAAMVMLIAVEPGGATRARRAFARLGPRSRREPLTRPPSLRRAKLRQPTSPTSVPTNGEMNRARHVTSPITAPTGPVSIFNACRGV